MVLAHGPAGYILSRCLPTSWQTTPIVGMAILGSIAPDFDFIVNILGISSQSHRLFITHTPSFWIISWVIALLIAKIGRADARPVHAFFMGTVLHVLLDIPTGIKVWSPFSEQFVELFPDLYFGVTLVEFLTHPYVIAEGVIILATILLWRQQHVRQ